MKKILFVFSFFFLGTSIIYGIFIYNGTGNTIIGSNNVDTYSSLGFSPISYDQYSDEYKNQNKRMYIEDATFTSEVYGDFSSIGRVELYKNNTVNSNCVGESVSYYFTGDFKNSDWGEGFAASLTPTQNYFCPDSGKFSIAFESDNPELFFEKFVITDTNEDFAQLIVEDSSGNEIVLDERVIFSNSKLSISGLVNNDVEINNEFNGGTQVQQDSNITNGVDYGVTNFGVGISDIKKNIENNYRFVDWNTSVNSINSFENDMLHDYTGTNGSFFSNINNKGKILEINNSGNPISISGVNNLIIKGGNLYIKEDIYNSNNESLLVIVVLRDKNNSSNGGNVYVDPSVTNIDAVIISEGSLLSYNGSSNGVLDSTNSGHIDTLRNQLLIYGSVFTKNTIGENVSPYFSDDYISSGSPISTGKYNLENLRTFQVVSTEQIIGNCNSSGGRVTAIGNNETTARKFAFAGKKECYFESSPRLGLRATHRTASTVIEYNPNIQKISPSILKIN